jgi:hypothetical protein
MFGVNVLQNVQALAHPEDFASNTTDQFWPQLLQGLTVPIFEREGKKILFVHIPKTGGTTIENLLQQAGWHMSLFTDWSNKFPGIPGDECTAQHMHIELLNRFVDWDEISYSFTIVRHPVARLISEFFFQRQYYRIYDLRPPRRSKRVGRNEFERWAADRLNKFEQDSFVYDNHLRPQNEFVGAQTIVYKFEDGIEKPLKELFPEDFAGLDVAPRYREGNAAAFSPRISKKITNQITKTYSGDLLSFGYVV